MDQNVNWLALPDILQGLPTKWTPSRCSIGVSWVRGEFAVKRSYFLRLSWIMDCMIHAVNMSQFGVQWTQFQRETFSQ